MLGRRESTNIFKVNGRAKAELNITAYRAVYMKYFSKSHLEKSCCITSQIYVMSMGQCKKDETPLR